MEFPEATKYPFMFYAPDLTDLKAPQRRSESRPEHLERILAFIEKGILSVYCRNVFLWSRAVNELYAT